MIVRMEGVVNGTSIIFYKIAERWEAAVPKTLNGEYIIEVTAFDEAGNAAYATKMLFTVDPDNLIVRLIPLKYYAEVEQNYSNAVLSDKYTVIICEEEVV